MDSEQSITVLGEVRIKVGKEKENTSNAYQLETTTKKSNLSFFEYALRSFLQRIVLLLSDLDPMIPVLLTLLIMRDGSSFDRQVVFVGALVALLMIEEIV